MKNKYLSLILLLVIFTAVFISTRDWRHAFIGAQEINNMDFAQVIGVDYDESTQQFIVTSASESYQSGGSSSSSKSKSSDSASTINNNIFTAEGESIFEAARNFELVSGQNIFWGLNKYILIGEEAAKINVGEELDMFIRNHENRLDVSVLIVKGTTANRFILSTLSGSNPISGIAGSALKNAEKPSISREVDLSEMADMLDTEYMSAYAPYVQIIQNDLDKKEEEGAEDPEVNGFAVFKGLKLFGFISGKTARGVNWVTNNIGEPALLIKDDTGNDVTMEVIQTKTKINVNFKGAVPQVEIKINFISNIAEQHSTANIYSKEKIEGLIKRQNEAVKEEIEAALAYCQSNGLDVFGIGDALYHKYPLKWQKIEGNWTEIFAGIKIDVNVISKIRGVYMLKEPIGYQEKEK